MLLNPKTLAAALKAYQHGKAHSLIAVGTKPHNLGKPVATRHPDGRNLYLSVSPTGAMSWTFMYVKNGKRVEMGLGSFTGAGRAASLTLAEARAKADQLRVQLQNPTIDLLRDRRQAVTLSKMTFAQMFEKHAEGRIKGNVWKNGGQKERKHWLGMLNKNAKALMAMQVDAIETSDIVAALEPIHPSRNAEVLETRIRAILNTAKNGYGHFKGRENPANKIAIRAVLMGSHETEGRIPLPWDRMSGLLAKLLAGGSVEELALAFLALTAVRSGEVRLALRSEVVGDLWTIPKERMGKSAKSGKLKPHTVPLSTQARAILDRLPVVEGNPYLFPGEGSDPMHVNCFNDLWDRLGLRGVAHVHGLRKTFRTYMGEKHEANGNLMYEPQLLEFCLAHVLKGSEGIYMSDTAVAARAIIMQAYADEAFGNKKAPAKLKAVA